MKAILVTGALCAVIGAAVGWWLTDDHHVTKQLKREAAQHAAETKRNDAIAQLSTEYYQLYQDAINREPVTITERVLVKASCPVRTDQAGGVDDAADAARAELARSTVQSVDRVVSRAEREYGKCAAQLAALQQVVIAQ